LTDQLLAEEPSPPEETPPDADQAWKALSLVNEWIRHSEAKTGASLGAAGVAGGLLYNLVKSKSGLPVWFEALCVVCAGGALLAILCAILALIPRLTLRSLFSCKRQTPDDWNNLLFYSHIAQKYRDDEPTYQEVLRALTLDKLELTKHIANQIHANSAVAHRKFTWCGRSVIFLAISIISLAVISALLGAKVV
jgi:hypothetical protein